MAGYIGSKASVVSSGVERKKTYSITGSTTSLTGLNYTVGKVHVFQNGVRLLDGTDYTATNGTSITLTVAAQSGDNVVVVSQASFQLSESYTSTEADAEFVTKTGDTMSGNLSFGDSDKAIFGAGSDLQVSHDGNNSLIAEVGTGNLHITAQDLRLQSANNQDTIKCVQNGAVTLYYDNASKLATTSTGIDVTGTVSTIGIYNSGIYNQTGDAQFWVTNVGEAVRIQQNTGNVGIGTSSPSAKLTIADENAGQAMLQVRNFSSSATGSFGNDHSAEFRSATSTTTHGVLIHHNENAIGRRTLDVSDNNGIFASFVQGKVGINETSPDDKVTINVSSSDNVRAIHLVGGPDITNKYISIGRTHTVSNDYIDSEIRFGAEAGGSGTSFLAFATGNNNSTERMRIDNSGNVLVGTTVVGQPNANAMVYDTSGMMRLSRANGNTGNYVYFIYNGLGVGSIANNGGSAVAYNTSSDYRLKTDAQPMTGASARVQALNPVNFEWISDGTRVDGFLAHEAQTVVPEAITGTKDAMRDEEYEVTPAVLDDDGNVTTEAVMGTRSVPDYQGIDQSKLVPLLTAALQEALTEIASLKTRVEALEA